jgi:putative sterol carrier protein
MTNRGPKTLDEAAEWLRKHFDADAGRGLCAAFQIELAGAEGGCIALRVDDGRLDVRRGATEAPHVVLRLSAGDYYALLAGRENADLLYMAGRLEIEGDLSRALKLRTLFQLPG